MATQRLAPPRINHSKEEGINQGGRQTKTHRKEEERKRSAGQRGNNKGVKNDDEQVVKESKGTASPWQFKGKGTTGNGKGQQVVAKTGGKETAGNHHPLPHPSPAHPPPHPSPHHPLANPSPPHLQLTLQVKVEGPLNHQQFGGDATATAQAAGTTGGHRTPVKVQGGGGGGGGGRRVGDGRKSGVPESLTTNTRPEIKPEHFRKKEACMGNRDGHGHIVSGNATGKTNGKKATVLHNKDRPSKVPGRGGDDVGLDVKDYRYLLKLLRINLPDGVLNTEVIDMSRTQTCITDACSIATVLEDFSLQFTVTPRLGCREVKRALALKTKADVLELTKLIFFENSKKEDRGTLMDTWKNNSAHTGKGFRMRDRYRNIPISTPAVYSTALTRSLRYAAEPKKDKKAKVTDGVRVNVKDVENMDYKDESLLHKPGGSHFGMFHQNKTDELECLKFFHELGEIGTSDQVRVRYSKGSKVDIGFLSGRLDFLARVQRVCGRKSMNVERLVIECKGTTGDMVGKLFIKSEEGNRAQLVERHEYCYQTQAYMYILNQEARLLNPQPVSNRAVMVIRHYHADGAKQRDFYWNYIPKDDSIQGDISDLVLCCEREVLACFLAVLDLIFQREIT